MQNVYFLMMRLKLKNSVSNILAFDLHEMSGNFLIINSVTICTINKNELHLIGTSVLSVAGSIIDIQETQCSMLSGKKKLRMHPELSSPEGWGWLKNALTA